MAIASPQQRGYAGLEESDHGSVACMQQQEAKPLS
jgi:hypothetical protein